MIAFTKLAKSFNLYHAIGFSIATHLVLLIFSPTLPANTTFKLENKVEKVHFEIIKKTKPLQIHKKKTRVHKKKSIPVVKQAMLKATTKTMPKPVHIKPLIRSSAQSVNFKPARKLSVSRIPSPAANQFNAAFVPINTALNNIVPSGPYAQRASTGMDSAKLLLDSKIARKVLSFTPLNNNSAGNAVRVSTRNFSSPSFVPATVKNIMKVSERKYNLLVGDDFKEIWGKYTNSIQLKIAQAKIYPPLARERKQQGKVFLSFKLDKNGEILELSIENSSGHKILDQAAMKAIKEAAPFPTIPVSLNKKHASLKIPISFVLR
jgi:TonB family protein